MNVDELLKQVAKRGGDVRAIYTGTGNPEDRYALIQEGGAWKAFYFEEGERLEFRVFASEAEACEYLLQLLIKDETVWSVSK